MNGSLDSIPVDIPVGEDLEGTGRRRRLTRVDVFTLLNAALLALMCVFAYYDRFVAYRGAGNVREFLVYALGLMAALTGLWYYFRTYPFPVSLLVVLEAGIVMHFAGGLVVMEGRRLYDHYLAGIRYDKVVHFVNAFVVAALVARLYRSRGQPLEGVDRLFVLLTVLGLGGMVEVMEYVVCKTVPGNGVGGYDNNMQDLIANLLGGSLAALVLYRGTRAAGRTNRGPG
jgi:uncharacterized membrane protein YjdF